MYITPLEGKKILFFSWPFYQYPAVIETKLKEMGAEVTTYLSSPTSDFLKVRFLEKFEFLKSRYFKQILEDVSKQKYDYVLMINAAVFPAYFVQKLPEVCGSAVRILYSWDSLSVYPKAKDLYGCFDVVYSFDTEDVKNIPELEFLPLFFCDNLYDEASRAEVKYDFSFIGFGHTERYQFIKKIQTFAGEHGYRSYFRLYLPSMIHFWYGKYRKKIFAGAKKNDFIYTSMTQEEIKKIVDESRIVIDMELGSQSGLTMRTIETHGMRKKLITTNPHVKEYDFYNEKNILVVDRANPVISKEFVESEYEILPPEAYQKYTLSHWLRTVFKV